MLWAAVIQKELLNHIGSFRFWVSTLLTLVLAASSTSIATRDYNERLRGYHERLANHQRELAGVTVYSALQPTVLRPPELLSILDQGFDANLGTDVTIHVFAVPVHAARAQRGNEFLVSVPAVDLTRIVDVVLGLLALLLSYDAFVGEQEEGTLRATLGHSVPRRTVLGGKILGGLLTLALPLAAGLLASLAILVLQAETRPTIDQWMRIAGLSASYAAYLSLMLLLGFLLSLHARSSSSALMVAVLFWLVFAVILPESAPTLAGSVLSTQEVRRDTERAQQALLDRYELQLNEEARRQPMLATFSGNTPISFTSGRNRSVLHRYGSAAYYDAKQRFHRFEVENGIRLAARLFLIHQEYEHQQRVGERLGEILAAPSPSFVLSRISESLAGTSIAEQDRFLAACRGYRLSLIRYLASKHAFSSWRWFTDDLPGQLHPWPTFLGLSLEQVDPAQVSTLVFRLTDPAVEVRVQRIRQALDRSPSRRLRLDDLPPFVFRQPGFLTSLRQVSAEIVTLCLLNVAAAGAAWASFRRFRLA